MKKDDNSKKLLENVAELKFTVTKRLGIEKKAKAENLQEIIDSWFKLTDKVDDLNE